MGKYQDVDLSKVADLRDLREALIKIADGFDLMMEAGLNERAIILLLHDSCGVGKREIASVLHALPRLKEEYCDRKVPKE